MFDRMKQGWALFTIFLLGFFLRVFSNTGMAIGDGLIFASVGNDLSTILKSLSFNFPASITLAIQQFVSLRSDAGLINVLYSLPNAVIYSILEINHWTTLISPVFISMIGLISIYFLARSIWTESIALIATMFWAIFPIALFGTSQNDLTISVLVTLFLLGLASSTLFIYSRSKLALTITGFATLLTIILDWLIGLELIVFLLLLILVKTGRERLSRLVVLFVFILYLLIIYSTQGAQVRNIFVIINDHPEWLPVLPLLLVSIIANAQTKNKKPSIAVYWLIAGLGILMINDFLRPGTIPELDPVNILFFLSPILLISQYLGVELNSADWKRFLNGFILIFALAIWLGWLGRSIFIPSYSVFPWRIAPSIEPILKIFGGLSILLSLASPGMMNLDSPRKNLFRYLLFSVFFLGLIPILWSHIEKYYYLDKAPDEAISFLEEQDLKLPLFIPDGQMHRKIGYYSGYDTKGISERIMVARSDEFQEIDSGYVLFPEEEFIDIPETWVYMGSFGPIGFPRLSIFRALDESLARDELNGALKLLQTNGDYSTYTRAYQALINLGRECDAYSYWIQGQHMSESTHGFILVNPESACFFDREASNLLEDQAVWQNLYGGYFYQESMDVPNIQDPVFRVAHKYLYYSDPRVFDIELELDPSSIYYYSASIQSDFPVWSLYFSLNNQEQYLQVRSFPNWSDVALLFVTPPSAEKSIHAKLSPVLFDHFANVFLRNPELINVSPD